jgi:predicted PhzF superfamily epimerase YddE/YHI9
VIHQGDEIGHPSTIRLRWDAANSSIGGTVTRDEVRLLDA